MFQNTEIGFTKMLALSIKPILFLSKEYVVRKGDIGSEVRCILVRILLLLMLSVNRIQPYHELSAGETCTLAAAVLVSS